MPILLVGLLRGPAPPPFLAGPETRQFSQLVLTTRAVGFGRAVKQRPVPRPPRLTCMSILPPQTLRRTCVMGLLSSDQTDVYELEPG